MTKEVTLNDVTSSLHIIQKDSIIKPTYKAVKKLYEKEKYSDALDMGLRVLDESKNKGDRETYIKINYLIGNILYRTYAYDKAIEYFHKSLNALKDINELPVDTDNYKSSENINKDSLISANLHRIGSSYHQLKEEFEEKDTLKANIYKDSALVYYNRVLSLNSLDRNVLKIRAKVYGNLSAIYINDSEYPKAEFYALKAVEVDKKFNDNIGVAASLSNLATIYLLEGEALFERDSVLAKKEFQKAKRTYLKATELVETNNSPNAIRYKASLYENLGWVMYKLKEYKAYEYQEDSYEIKDKLRDKEIREMVERISAEYNVETAKTLVRQEEQSKTLIITIVSISILIILFFIARYYKLRQNNLQLTLSQTQLLQEKNIEKLRSETQIRVINATIDGKETERKQIAETLHDSVSSLLSSASLHLQASRTQFNGSTPVEIRKTQSIITEASEKIRDLSHTLVSSILLKFGLQYAIKDMAEKYSNSKINIETAIKPLRRYHQDFEIKMNNIIQEFVNNILKHSNAENATIYLEEKEGRLCLKIEDDGDGFNVNEISKKDGLGINQIDARIQMMKGEFKIKSVLGEGTKIQVELPIQEKEVVASLV